MHLNPGKTVHLALHCYKQVSERVRDSVRARERERDREWGGGGVA